MGRRRTPQTVVQIIAKGLPYVEPMRTHIAQDIYDEIVATGYAITFAEPEIKRIPSSRMAHHRKRNRERLQAEKKLRE